MKAEKLTEQGVYGCVWFLFVCIGIEIEVDKQLA